MDGLESSGRRLIFLNVQTKRITCLAVQSSSRSLVVGWFVRRSVGRSVGRLVGQEGFVKK